VSSLGITATGCVVSLTNDDNGLLPGAMAERRPEAYPVCPVCDKMLDRVAEYTLECPGCRCQFHPEHLAQARATRDREVAAAVKPLVAFVQKCAKPYSQEWNDPDMPVAARLKDIVDAIATAARSLLSPPGDAAERNTK
jgi:hypothetical protein